MITKKIIKQATDYSNLSQWIQMEIWKYYERDWIDKDCTELTDRIIKRVLEDKNLVNNKIHKEGFDAGYNKALKEVEKVMDIVIGYIGSDIEQQACLNRWKTLKPKRK